MCTGPRGETIVEKITAHFDIKYTRYLDPSGKLVQTLPKEIDKATLTAFYRALVRPRTFDASVERANSRPKLPKSATNRLKIVSIDTWDVL